MAAYVGFSGVVRVEFRLFDSFSLNPNNTKLKEVQMEVEIRNVRETN